MALWYLKQSSVTPRLQAIWLFHNNKKIVRVLEYCDDVQWCVTNKEWHRERAACMCFRSSVRCYFLVYFAIFMCSRRRLSALTNSEMLGNSVLVQGFLPRHAKDGCRKTPDRGTPKNCRVITPKQNIFLPRNMIKKKLTQLSCISVMRVVFVWGFFPFNFLSVKKQTILDSVFWLIAMTFLFKTWHNFCNNTEEKYNTLYTVHNKRCEDNSYVDYYMTNSNG